MIPNIVVSISGLPKSGKTHLALTFPEPIKVFSFDGRSDQVRQRNFKDKNIEVENISVPIVESEDDTGWAPKVWEPFYKKYKEDVESGKYQTIVLDTATTAHTILNQAVFEWVKEAESDRAAERGQTTRGRQKLAVNEYHTRNLLMKALFDLPKNQGVNLVVIQYLGEKWVTLPGKKMAEPTGELKVQGWAQTEAFADVNIEMGTKTRVIVGGKKPVDETVMVATIKSTGFDRQAIGQSLVDTNYDELIAVLLGDNG